MSTPRRRANTRADARTALDGPAATPPVDSRPPASVRWAGMLGMAQGAVGILFGVLLVVREAQGFHDPGAKISGYGTAAWFFAIFGAVAAAGWFLFRGKGWGRGPVAMLQMILLLISYYMFTSGRPELGVPTALLSIVGLVLLFNPQAVAWAATRHSVR